MFPAPPTVSAPPPQPSPHMAHGGGPPPPPPPPSYDEDAAAQAQAAAAARGYTVYAYAPFYPGQVRYLLVLPRGGSPLSDTSLLSQ